PGRNLLKGRAFGGSEDEPFWRAGEFFHGDWLLLPRLPDDQRAYSPKLCCFRSVPDCLESDRHGISILSGQKPEAYGYDAFADEPSARREIRRRGIPHLRRPGRSPQTAVRPERRRG